MARTRSKRNQDSLTAAAMPLVDKGQNSLLYNSRVIDYLTNSAQSGATKLAWMYWGRIPELRYTARYISNALSVATLYVGIEDNSGAEPERLPDDHPANDLIRDFAGGPAGQAELLDRLGLHLTVAGDSVLMGPLSGASYEQPFDQWRVFSTEEVFARNGKIFVRMPEGREVQIPDNILPVRIWRPHPVTWWDAESPVKGSFSVLRELDLLDQHVHATAVSRLIGAGLMTIPEEIDLPGAEDDTEGTEIDKFVMLLTEVMGTAIKNRESAAALVPIMLRGPSEYLDKINHIDFSTNFSEQIPELREGAIRRLALGMDVPPEILLGSAQSTSWSAWQTDESTLRVHLKPFLNLITDSLTVGWLRPALESLPLSDTQKKDIPNLVVHYDVSNLQIRQDISGDAQALYDRFEIDSAALRLATGYGPNSAPDDKELAKQILLAHVKGTNPELVKYAINALRKNFNVTELPEFVAEDPAAAGPGPGAPGQAGMPIEEPEINGPLPGERSQDKQVEPPPLPDVGGDQGNNEIK